MGASVTHHTALRVQDIERSAQFYIKAFDAKWLLHPVSLEEDTEGDLGQENLPVRIAILGFGDGGLELFEFASRHPLQPSHPADGNILHIAVQVENVQETLERVEAAGGSRIWKDVSRFDTASIIYVADPDGNVLELIDCSLEQLIATIKKDFPDTDPDAVAG